VSCAAPARAARAFPAAAAPDQRACAAAPAPLPALFPSCSPCAGAFPWRAARAEQQHAARPQRAAPGRCALPTRWRAHSPAASLARPRDSRGVWFAERAKRGANAPAALQPRAARRPGEGAPEMRTCVTRCASASRKCPQGCAARAQGAARQPRASRSAERQWAVRWGGRGRGCIASGLSCPSAVGRARIG